MLKAELTAWKTRLPVLKDQHDKLKVCVDALNTKGAAMRASLEDIELD